MDSLVGFFHTILDIIYWIYDFITNGKYLWFKIPLCIALFFLVYIPYKDNKEEKEYLKRFYHCDSCGRDDALVYESSKELERYKGYTDVTETLASGKKESVR